MTRALSDDLRKRVIEAVDGGMSRRAAATRFGIGASTAVTDLWDAIAAAIDAIKPDECANYFAAAGYESE